jgi:hypothetical protein
MEKFKKGDRVIYDPDPPPKCRNDKGGPAWFMHGVRPGDKGTVEYTSLSGGSNVKWDKGVTCGCNQLCLRPADPPKFEVGMRLRLLRPHFAGEIGDVFVVTRASPAGPQANNLRTDSGYGFYNQHLNDGTFEVLPPESMSDAAGASAYLTRLWDIASDTAIYAMLAKEDGSETTNNNEKENNMHYTTTPTIMTRTYVCNAPLDKMTVHEIAATIRTMSEDIVELKALNADSPVTMITTEIAERVKVLAAFKRAANLLK